MKLSQKLMHDAAAAREKEKKVNEKKKANNKDPNTTKKENEEEDDKDDKIDVSIDPSAVDLEEGTIDKEKVRNPCKME